MLFKNKQQQKKEPLDPFKYSYRFKKEFIKLDTSEYVETPEGFFIFKVLDTPDQFFFLVNKHHLDFILSTNTPTQHHHILTLTDFAMHDYLIYWGNKYYRQIGNYNIVHIEA